MIKVKNKVLAIMQARMSSTRLPGKILKEVSGTPLLAYEIARLRQAKNIDKLVIATSSEPEDDVVLALCAQLGVDCFRGSLDDVLSRYAECAKQYEDYDTIVRITGDCPLIDPVVTDRVISFFKENQFDYASNTPAGEETYPDGMDTEVFTLGSLLDAAEHAQLLSEREHVTLYIRNTPKYILGSVHAESNHSKYRLTVDDSQDFEVVKFLIENCRINAGYLDYVRLLDAHPEIRSINMQTERNEGLKKSLENDSTVKT